MRDVRNEADEPPETRLPRWLGDGLKKGEVEVFRGRIKQAGFGLGTSGYLNVMVEAVDLVDFERVHLGVSNHFTALTEMCAVLAPECRVPSVRCEPLLRDDLARLICDTLVEATFEVRVRQRTTHSQRQYTVYSDWKRL